MKNIEEKWRVNEVVCRYDEEYRGLMGNYGVSLG